MQIQLVMLNPDQLKRSDLLEPYLTDGFEILAVVALQYPTGVALHYTLGRERSEPQSDPQPAYEVLQNALDNYVKASTDNHVTTSAAESEQPVDQLPATALLKRNWGPGTNSGHGHVWPRPDGVKARCGGPRMCHTCSLDRNKLEQGS